MTTMQHPPPLSKYDNKGFLTKHLCDYSRFNTEDLRRHLITWMDRNIGKGRALPKPVGYAAPLIFDSLKTENLIDNHEKSKIAGIYLFCFERYSKSDYLKKDGDYLDPASFRILILKDISMLEKQMKKEELDFKEAKKMVQTIKKNESKIIKYRKGKYAFDLLDEKIRPPLPYNEDF